MRFPVWDFMSDRISRFPQLALAETGIRKLRMPIGRWVEELRYLGERGQHIMRNTENLSKTTKKDLPDTRLTLSQKSRAIMMTVGCPASHYLSYPILNAKTDFGHVVTGVGRDHCSSLVDRKGPDEAKWIPCRSRKLQ